jgi:hypothetical protein
VVPGLTPDTVYLPVFTKQMIAHPRIEPPSSTLRIMGILLGDPLGGKLVNPSGRIIQPLLNPTAVYNKHYVIHS